jgi:anti-sigma factor RsiW
MKVTELDLMRLLRGELPEDRARTLRERLKRDPDLERKYQRLRHIWEGLDLPPAAPVPIGFTQRVMARARADRAENPVASLSLRGAPVWVRAAAAAALVAGTVLGIGVGGRLPVSSQTAQSPQITQTVQPSATEETETGTLAGDIGDTDDSLAGSYWETVEGLQ